MLLFTATSIEHVIPFDDDTCEETYIYSGIIPPSALICKEYFNI